MTDWLLQRYRRLLAQGDIEPDNAQELAVEKLQILSNRLTAYTPPSRTDFFSFFTRRRGELPKGLYIYGGVGRGKTMLMDLFYETVPVDHKKRAHFHEFMAEVHSRLGEVRSSSKNGDAILVVAQQIASNVRLLALDELFILDIADASIVSRLFAALLDAGTVIVVTSNVHPQDLYKEGRNRDLFLPFLDLIQDKLEVLQLEASRDYRLKHLGRDDLYFTPLNEPSHTKLDEIWRRLTLGQPCSSETLRVLGHNVSIPCACMGAARFQWPELFQHPLGAQDFLSMARRYHTIFVEGIPVLSRERKNEARRFITFIDTLYDQATGLVVTAQAEPDELYQAGDGSDHFQRTASRLMEMRSPDYRSKKQRQK